LLGFSPVSAQEKTADKPPAKDSTVVLETLVVTGVRASLISAQEIKKNSVQLVDSVVAEDIGKLPDNTVADALQRVPGIQVARDNGEVNSVVIRGLPNLGTTLNGHEIFTGTGRGVALQDIPAELVAGVDVYKTNSPDQIEGGIAGLIDIRLRRPFDFSGFQLAGGGRMLFSKYADKNSWVASALVSNRWKLNGGGEFGALLSISDQTYNFKDQRVFNFLWEPVNTTFVAGQTAIVLPVTAGSLLVPGERQRPAYNLSLQWRPNNELELYSDVLFTGYRNKRQVHFFIGFPRFGAFQSVVLQPGTNVVKSEVTTNNFHLNSTQAFKDRTDSYQAVFGARWTRDKLKLDTEVVYNWSSFKNRGVIVDVQYAPPTPSTFTFDLNNGSGTNVTITNGSIKDANNFRLWGLFDNHGYATSKQTAWKVDADYQLSDSFFTNVKAGLRIAQRDARSRQTSQNDIPPAAGRGVTPTASIPGFGSLAPDGLFSTSEFGASNWYAGDPDFLRDHTEIIRPLFGQPVTDPNFNPTQSFTDSEDSYAAYIQAHYRWDITPNPVEGTLGLRVVSTKEGLVGNLSSGAPVNSSTTKTDILPVFNARVRLENELYFRFSAGRSITRPNFADLNPVVSLFGPTTTGGALGTGSGGNPDLKSVKSDNIDLSFENYFTKDSSFTLTGFYRRIDGYVQTFASTESIGGVSYSVVRPRNAGKGHLNGMEASYQQFFDFLPDWLKGLGVQTNFTYITGSTDTADTTPGAALGARTTKPYAQVSKYSYNVIGLYERGPWSARLAYNWRGSYVDTFNGPNAAGSPLRTISVRATSRMDFSASYNFGKNFTVTLDATNLLNQKYKDYFGADASLYPRDSRLYDRTIEVGVRYRY
jgi:TonB-dependent receptor